MIKLTINMIEETLKDPNNEFAGKRKHVYVDTEHIEGSPKAIAALLRGLADDLDKAPVRQQPYAINHLDPRVYG
jgi:hypothetical protein